LKAIPTYSFANSFPPKGPGFGTSHSRMVGPNSYEKPGFTTTFGGFFPTLVIPFFPRAIGGPFRED